MTTARDGNIKITIDSEEIECMQEFIFQELQINQSSEWDPKLKLQIPHRNDKHKSSMEEQGHQIKC